MTDSFILNKIKVVLTLLSTLFVLSSASGQSDSSSTSEVISGYQKMLNKRWQALDSVLLQFDKASSDETRLKLLFNTLDLCPMEDNPIYIKKVDSLLLLNSNGLAEQKISEYRAQLFIYKIAYQEMLDNQDVALKLCEQEIEFRESIRDTIGLHDRYRVLSSKYENNGDFGAVLATFKRAVAFFEAQNYLSGESKYMYQLSLFYTSLGEFDEALAYVTGAQEIEREIGDTTRITRGKYLLGLFFEQNNYLDSASFYYEHALKRARRFKDSDNTIQSLVGLGKVNLIKGHSGLAIKKYLEAFELAKSAKDYQYVYKISIQLGKAYMAENQLEKAELVLLDIKKILGHFNIAQPLAYTNAMLAQLAYINGDYIKAQNSISQALPEIMKGSFPDDKLYALEIAYKIDSALGDYETAFKYYQRHITIKNERDNSDLLLNDAKARYKSKLALSNEKNIADKRLHKLEVAKKNSQLKSERKTKIVLFSGLSLALILGLVLLNRFRITRKQKEVIESQKSEVDAAYYELEVKNTEILDSINYAKRIQSAILPSHKLVKKHLNESFVLYKPKDIVAGDFYWMEVLPGSSAQGGELEEVGNTVLFAAADCTGHGVPGAMVSVVCNNGLNRSVREYGLTEPGKILDKTREIVISEFEKSEEDVKDGMDIALCSLTSAQKEKQSVSGTIADSELKAQSRSVSEYHALLNYAGAHNPLWIIRRTVSAETGEGFVLEELKAEFSADTKLEQHGDYLFIEVKADKQPIGKFDEPQPYTTHTIELKPGDSFYIFSDGYADQFGGEKGKKLKAKNFKELLLSVQDEPMDRQRELIDEAFEKWKGSFEQLDDVCVIGVRV